jgi:hypothetical protein
MGFLRGLLPRALSVVWSIVCVINEPQPGSCNIVTLLLRPRYPPRERTLHVASVETEEAGKHVGESSALPSYYFIDESDPNVVVLCRQDGSFVAAFSVLGGPPKGPSWRLPRRTTTASSQAEGSSQERPRASEAFFRHPIHRYDLVEGQGPRKSA